MPEKHPKETMNPKERVLSALERKKLDRPAVINPTSIATVECMEVSGAYAPEVHINSEKMARLAATGYEIIGFDTISPYFSVQQEAAAMGCDMNWGSIDSMPDIKTNPYNDPDEIEIPADFLDQQATSAVIEALRMLKKNYGDHVCLVGKVMGPWTLSYHMYGVQKFLMDTIKNPDKVRRFLDKLKEVTVLFADAQIKAGADVITLADHLTGDLAGPNAYRDFLLPLHQELTKRIESPVVLHICGRTTDRMSYIAQAGFDAFHFDSKNDLQEATKIAEEEGLLLTGDINNPDILYDGSVEDVRSDVKDALEAGVTLISPECAIPLRTPNANLQAIVETVREYSFGSK